MEVASPTRVCAAPALIQDRSNVQEAILSERRARDSELY
jgi:hypothetical protein